MPHRPASFRAVCVFGMDYLHTALARYAEDDHAGAQALATYTFDVWMPQVGELYRL